MIKNIIIVILIVLLCYVFTHKRTVCFWYRDVEQNQNFQHFCQISRMAGFQSEVFINGQQVVDGELQVFDKIKTK